MDRDVVGLAGPVVAILGVQFILVFCFALFFVFRLMGRDYEAAIMRLRLYVRVSERFTWGQRPRPRLDGEYGGVVEALLRGS
jgi:hypothetical protein